MTVAQKVAENIRKKLMPDSAWSTLQHYYTIPYHVAIKFANWDELLRMCQTDTVKLKYPTAIRHYARGLALVGKQQLPQEPPDWFFSVRHNLGAVLLRAKRYHEAEAVLANDLSVFPRNGWALLGLHKAQMSQGLTEKAQHTGLVERSLEMGR